MSTWAVVLIIALVLGVILSNIMLLKYTTHLKMPDTFKADKYKSCEDIEDRTKKEADIKPASGTDKTNDTKS